MYSVICFYNIVVGQAEFDRYLVDALVEVIVAAHRIQINRGSFVPFFSRVAFFFSVPLTSVTT